MGKCYTCEMLRATKDLVLLENGSFMCFSCWNKELKKTTTLKSKTENPNS